MKKNRFIPLLLYKDGNIVQSRGFKHHKIISKADTVLSRFSSWDADELCLVNISSDDSYNEQFVDTISQLSKVCKMPLCAGGGIRSTEQGIQLIQAGADKIYLNYACLHTPSTIRELISILGSQAITASIQYLVNGTSRVIRHYSTTYNNLVFEDYLHALEDLGVGEVSLVCESNDGMSCGYDLEGISIALDVTHLPIIPFGGARTVQHCIDAYSLPGLEAIAAGNLFHFQEQSYVLFNQKLRECGIMLRDLSLHTR